MCPVTHTHSITFKVHTLNGFTYGVRYTRRTHAQTQTETLLYDSERHKPPGGTALLKGTP